MQAQHLYYAWLGSCKSDCISSRHAYLVHACASCSQRSHVSVLLLLCCHMQSSHSARDAGELCAAAAWRCGHTEWCHKCCRPGEALALCQGASAFVLAWSVLWAHCINELWQIRWTCRADSAQLLILNGHVESASLMCERRSVMRTCVKPLIPSCSYPCADQPSLPLQLTTCKIPIAVMLIRLYANAMHMCRQLYSLQKQRGYILSTWCVTGKPCIWCV